VASTGHPDFREMICVFTRIGFLSFGGPAGQIALMHRELVEERRWVEEDQYLHALNLCHLLPGPEAPSTCRLDRLEAPPPVRWTGGGSALRPARGRHHSGADDALSRRRTAGLVRRAVPWDQGRRDGCCRSSIRIAGRALNTAFKKALAVTAFLALFLFAAPFPLVVLEAGVIGMVVAAARPDWLANILRVYVCMDMRISGHIRGADG